MTLRRVCRELVLEVVLRRALAVDGGELGDGRLQLIVDEATLKVLNSFLRMADLHAEGVTSMELIERQREPLPGLDALYLLRPDVSNIELVLNDFKKADSPQHRQVHLVFSRPLAIDLFALLAEGPQLAPRVKSFVEAPLSFTLVQDRGFHFDMLTAIPGLFPKADPILVDQISTRLADVCRCLQVTSPCIRYAQADVCKTVAEKVQQELLSMRGIAREGQVPCQLLIVDRSVDMAATLVHEYTYEAMAYDLLDGGILDTDRNIVTTKGGTAEEKQYLLSDADPLWEELKHQHLEVVTNVVQTKINEAQELGRVHDPTQVNTSDMLEKVRRIPEHRDHIERLMAHVSMVQCINERLDEERLMTVAATGVGLLEQDIACGVDRLGNGVKATNLQSNMTKLFTDFETSMPSESKLRLLMLYFVSFDNVPPPVRDKIRAYAKLTDSDDAVLRNMLATHLMDVPESQRKNTGQYVHRVTKEQAARFKKNVTTEGRLELSRFEPRVKSLVEQLANKRISSEEFPVLPEEGDRFGAQSGEGLRTVGAMGCGPPGMPALPVADDWSFAPAPRSYGATLETTEVMQRIIVFIIGGITFSELRAVSEAAQGLPRGAEVIIGGTALLTPKRLIRVLRPPVSSPDVGTQDAMDLT